MDALILSAGLGSRLGKLTEYTPKPMLNIGNKPLLQITLEKVVSLGVGRIFINTHYKHEVISSFIQAMSDLQDNLVVLYEPKLLGTAGTVKNLLNSYDIDNLIVMHGDNYFEDDLSKLLAEFYLLSEYYWGVVGYFKTNDPKNFGIFELDVNNTVINFQEKSASSLGKLANSAIYVFNSRGLSTFLELQTQQPDISLNILPKLIGRLKAVELYGVFLDIGTPENLQKAINISNGKIN
jgi:mannose-1-phosphate guanylyltransferase